MYAGVLRCAQLLMVVTPPGHCVAFVQHTENVLWWSLQDASNQAMRPAAHLLGPLCPSGLKKTDIAHPSMLIELCFGALPPGRVPTACVPRRYHTQVTRKVGRPRQMRRVCVSRAKQAPLYAPPENHDQALTGLTKSLNRRMVVIEGWWAGGEGCWCPVLGF